MYRQTIEIDKINIEVVYFIYNPKLFLKPTLDIWEKKLNWSKLLTNTKKI